MDILARIGLTSNEMKAYLSALELGPSSATKIAHGAKVHRSKAYESLKSLSDKGLISVKIYEGVQQFIACNPSHLLMLLDEKREELDEQQRELEKAIPKLESQMNNAKQTRATNTYSGIRGIKVFHEQILSQIDKDDIMIMGIPVIANELLEGYFMDFHKRRIQKRIAARMIYSYEAKGTAKKRAAMKLTQTRFLGEGMPTPSTVWMSAGTIGIFSFYPSPACFEIRDEETFESFKTYFEFLWEHAKRA